MLVPGLPSSVWSQEHRSGMPEAAFIQGCQWPPRQQPPPFALIYIGPFLVRNGPFWSREKYLRNKPTDAPSPLPDQIKYSSI